MPSALLVNRTWVFWVINVLALLLLAATCDDPQLAGGTP